MTDGERWARQLLADLRAARFTPGAWLRFVSRSFARASERRRERSRASRQTIALAFAGFAAWTGTAAAGRPALGAAGAGWWLLVVLMLDWHLGMLERLDGRPLRGLGAPNVLALLRASLVPALPVLSPTALAIALGTAQATDVLDGRLARSRDEVTRLGSWLDGAVDGLLLGVAAVAAARAGAIPGWAAGLVVARYAFPWLAVAAFYFAAAAPPPREGHVSGRLPGFVLLVGLALSSFWTGGEALVVAGAAGGLLTFAATIARFLAPAAGRRRASQGRTAPPDAPIAGSAASNGA